MEIENNIILGVKAIMEIIVKDVNIMELNVFIVRVGDNGLESP